MDSVSVDVLLTHSYARMYVRYVMPSAVKDGAREGFGILEHELQMVASYHEVAGK